MPTQPIPVQHTSGLDLASGFRQPWRPVRRSLLYRGSLIAVASMMLIIPLMYLAVLGTVIYFTQLHAISDLDPILKQIQGTRSGRAQVTVFLFGYLAPIAIGLIVLWMLASPIFRLSRHERDAYTIWPTDEPALYAFVEALCAYIGSPPPKRIDIDSRVNASASFRRGMFSVFRRGDLVLTIGLPLVAGMNLNQFSGVLAHEFGHFSQGAGMRAGYLIGAINGWLARIVYARGKLDAWLQEPGDTNLLGLLFTLLARLGLWLTRAFFWVLLMLAHAISCIMARQMEFDADRHQARFSGAANFEPSFRRLVELSASLSAVGADLRDCWKTDKRLPDDLPALIADGADRLPADVRDSINKELTQRHPHLFQTHPPTADRIAAVNADAEPGVFSLDAPARVLFRDFHAECRKASYGYYKEMLGGLVETATLVPSEPMLAAGARHSASRSALLDLLGFEPPAWRPLLLSTSAASPSDDPKRTYEKLKQARTQLASASSKITAAAEAFRKADDLFVRCDQVEAHFAVGESALPKGYEFPARGRHGLSATREKAIADMGAASAVLDAGADLGAVRIGCALRLLYTKGSESRIPDAPALRARAGLLLQCSQALRDVMEPARRVRSGLAKAVMIAPHLQDKKRHDKAKELLRPISDSVRDALADVRQIAGGIPYPFPTPQGEEINFGARLVDASPGWREFDQIFSAADDFLERFPVDVQHVAAELAEIALTVERSLTPGAQAGSPVASSSPRRAS